MAPYVHPSCPHLASSRRFWGHCVALQTLGRIRQSLVSSRPLGFDDCIKWARLQFEELFSSSIKQLLHNFPLEMLTSTGAPFWSGHKRAPIPEDFDPQDPLHLAFVMSAANLRAQVFV